MEIQETLNNQSNCEKKKNKAGGITLPVFKIFNILQSYHNQNSMVLAGIQINRSIEQNWEPRNNPCTYGQLIYDKVAKNIHWRKDNLFNKWCWEIWRAICKKMDLDLYLTPYTEINSKWIKDLKGRPETIKLEENIGITLFDISHSNIFQDMSPQATQETKAKINKWDYTKLKRTAQETINKTKRQLNGRIYFQII